jgi:hypothetical protein
VRPLELLEEHPSQAGRRGSGRRSAYDQNRIEDNCENRLKNKTPFEKSYGYIVNSDSDTESSNIAMNRSLEED